VTVLAWRLGILVAILAVWEVAVRPLNPIFYVPPSALPGALDEQTRLLMGEWLVGIRRRARKAVVFVTHSLHEAIALSDRIVVMTARPGRIKDVIDVTLPFPRDLNAPEVTDLRAKLWEQVREESLKAMGNPP